MSDENNNFGLYNRLKLEVSGGFFGVQNYSAFFNLLCEIENKDSSLDNSFILISTGSSFKKIEKLCNRSKKIKSIFIYCRYTNNYKYLEKFNSKVDLVSNNINEIYIKLKFNSVVYENYDKKLKNLIDQGAFISWYEYKKYYYIFHKILSFFFKEDFSNLEFTEGYMKKIINFINKNVDKNELKGPEKSKFQSIIIKLKYSKNLYDFVSKSLELYTKESNYVYIINKTMRKIEKGLARLSFLIGPMYYSIVRFLKYNPSYLLDRSVILFRNIETTEYNLNLFTMAQNNIICFPSFTSTSLKRGNFSPTANAQNINNINNANKINITMVLHYNHKFYSPPQGMILKEFSKHPEERKVLLFPFTFVKVNKLKPIGNNYELDYVIINKDKLLEFGLRNELNVELDKGILTVK